jgi:hypothetical protein
MVPTGTGILEESGPVKDRVPVHLFLCVYLIQIREGRKSRVNNVTLKRMMSGKSDKTLK